MLTLCCLLGHGKVLSVQYAIECDLQSFPTVYSDEAEKPTGIHKVTKPVKSFFQGKEAKVHDPRQEIRFELVAYVTEKDSHVEAGKSRARIGYMLLLSRLSPKYPLAASMPVAEC